MSYTIQTADIHTAISSKYPDVDIINVGKSTSDNRCKVITNLGTFVCESVEDHSDGIVYMNVHKLD
jgi:hypothetical protein